MLRRHFELADRRVLEGRSTSLVSAKSFAP